MTAREVRPSEERAGRTESSDLGLSTVRGCSVVSHSWSSGLGLSTLGDVMVQVESTATPKQWGIARGANEVPKAIARVAMEHQA